MKEHSRKIQKVDSFNVKTFPFCYRDVWYTSRVLGSDLGTTIITQQNVSSPYPGGRSF